jgi:hypothetical protein
MCRVARFDLGQWSLWFSQKHRDMNPPREEPRPGKDEPQSKLTRSEEVRQIIQEYVDDLREIIRKLRRRLN